jgi:hypothetical protein
VQKIEVVRQVLLDPTSSRLSGREKASMSHLKRVKKKWQEVSSRAAMYRRGSCTGYYESLEKNSGEDAIDYK